MSRMPEAHTQALAVMHDVAEFLIEGFLSRW